jgi:hypothetical protein
LNDKNGKIHVLENPDESPEDLLILNMNDMICTNGERGLHSLAIHPNFTTNQWIYAFYTYKNTEDCLESPVTGPWNVVSRFTMNSTTLELNLNDTVQVWRGKRSSGRQILTRKFAVRHQAHNVIFVIINFLRLSLQVHLWINGYTMAAR